MTLEDLVPPLELCKKIPKGSFADSAFVWVFNHQKARKAYPETAEDDAYFDLELRDIVDAGEQAVESGKEVWTNRPPYYPAPTLQEILIEMQPYGEGSPAEAVLSLWLMEHEVAE